MLKFMLKLTIVVFAVIGVFSTVEGIQKDVKMVSNTDYGKEYMQITDMYQDEGDIEKVTVVLGNQLHNRVIELSNGESVYLNVFGDGEYIEEVKRK